ncbi:hypothetical protein GCM10017559_61540 [Streptosporangium longisporum]|uniref:Uncharacterized protein n=2 Tax=Streptosporangium longisporum TaxID=46187 RepID=A0ABP6L414_9ACTN
MKTIDESRPSTTTLSPDSHLKLIPDPWGVYEVVGRIKYRSAAGADFKFSFTLPSGSRFDFFALGPNAGAADENALRMGTFNWSAGDTNTAVYGGIGSSTDSTLYIRGLLFTEDTIGDFGLEWAQQVSTASTTRVRYCSTLVMEYVEENIGYSPAP